VKKKWSDIYICLCPFLATPDLKTVTSILTSDLQETHATPNQNHLSFKMILPPTVYQFLVGVFAALGSFLYGYDLTIVAEGQSVFAMNFNPFTQMQNFEAKHLESGG
jgi:hypothetical protein